jgi:DNA-binding response OmpR family regulator
MTSVLSMAVVDNDPSMRELLRDVLLEEGYRPYLFDGTDGTTKVSAPYPLPP